MTNLRRGILAGIVLTLLALMHAYATTPVAQAHTITKAKCKAAATSVVKALPRAARKAHVWRKAYRKCSRWAKRHAAQHERVGAIRRCLAVRVTGMGRRVCAAFVDGARQAGLPASWAYDRALHYLLSKESGADPNAVNDSSDACGMGQRLVSGKHIHPKGGRGCPWGFTVIGWKNGRRIEKLHVPALVQAKDMLRYIHGRYRTPSRAIAFHNRVGWY